MHEYTLIMNYSDNTSSKVKKSPFNPISSLVSCPPSNPIPFFRGNHSEQFDMCSFSSPFFVIYLDTDILCPPFKKKWAYMYIYLSIWQIFIDSYIVL